VAVQASKALVFDPQEAVQFGPETLLLLQVLVGQNLIFVDDLHKPLHRWRVLLALALSDLATLALRKQLANCVGFVEFLLGFEVIARRVEGPPGRAGAFRSGCISVRDGAWLVIYLYLRV